MAEEFTRSCCGGRVGAGMRTRYGKALAAPGRVHPLGRLGNLRRVEWLHDAIRFGRRAAAEILASTNWAHRASASASPRRGPPSPITTMQPFTAWLRYGAIRRRRSPHL